MIERTIEIASPDGTIDGFLYSDPSGAPKPGVIKLIDIGGIRDSNRAAALRLAEQGFTVLLPNVFYRSGRSPLFSSPFVFGEEKTMKRLGELASPLTPATYERDASIYVDYLATQPSVRTGSLGVVGYCFTGGFALRVAAARPDKIAVAASFHGGRLFQDSETSPHRVLPRVKARLYFGHAIKDNSMPQEAIDKLNEALSAWGGRYESVVYDGALHGWTHTDSAVYNETQAERAFAELTKLLHEELG
ncbi:MAG TPA: dienelactone hydrolase family protein [Polyangiales bacterium]|nr:dienelactone hydrolase family protein [Polyangiales bacterium]